MIKTPAKYFLIGGATKSYMKGSILFVSGDHIQKIFYLIQGSVQLIAIRPDGYRQVIERYKADDFIAPHSLFGERYFFTAEAHTYIETIEYPTKSFRKTVQSEGGRTFWAEVLHGHLFRSLKRVEMLAYPTVSEKLDAWIKLFGGPPSRGEYTSVANELGVSREALYRELGKRRGG
jgi:CRP-like cAMP-binding protein